MFVLPPEMRADAPAQTAPAPPTVAQKQQEVLPPEPVKRDEFGRIYPGQPALPGAGRPPMGEADRRFKPRARELMNQYTIGQMKEMVKNGDFDNKIHPWDAVIIRNILAAATQGGQELKILLDRVEGAVQKQEDEKVTSQNIYNQTVVIKQYGKPAQPRN